MILHKTQEHILKRLASSKTVSKFVQTMFDGRSGRRQCSRGADNVAGHGAGTLQVDAGRSRIQESSVRAFCGWVRSGASGASLVGLLSCRHEPVADARKRNPDAPVPSVFASDARSGSGDWTAVDAGENAPASRSLATLAETLLHRSAYCSDFRASVKCAVQIAFQ